MKRLETAVVQTVAQSSVSATPWMAACQFPALHHLLELAQTHLHCVSDAIQPFQPLPPPSPPALSLSQHQGLFQ